jgi:chromosome segregation ATPase
MERYIFSPGVDLVGDIDISQKEIEILKIQLQNMKKANNGLQHKI